MLDRYVGRPVPVEELNGMLAEIDALHQAKGFVARVILPPQTIDDGAVQVQLIEGRINQVVIDGNRYTRDGFIQRRLGLGPGDLVDLNAMAASVSHGPPQFVGLPRSAFNLLAGRRRIPVRLGLVLVRFQRFGYVL